MNAKKIIEKYNLDEQDIDRIINMAWEDRTPFEAIERQFRVKENEVIAIMKYSMRLNAWKKWRKRVQGRKTKHEALRGDGVNRFRSKAQKDITGHRISKKKY